MAVSKEKVKSSNHNRCASIWARTLPQKKTELSSGRQALCGTGFPARWVFQAPACVCVPAGALVRGCIQLQWIFFNILWTHCPFHDGLRAHLLTPRWVFSSVWPKPHDPHAMPHPPYSPDLTPSDFFCFLGWKTSSKGKVLPMWKRWNRKQQTH